eukprot:CAMPEP_0202725840 /NCGR_PEP_ID=MMETSP1385-20130828/184306_1 /ASSEMBLY_ACC=CAM_ASM_000861 /TAXON_ID=933848 /ORGANISM="Elphidium margaritaceum" /LENGTH=497 /DNA_ID=CAMNT_0049392045 /DNA_START=101 /DNA_END=1594 /DNA_ORIENTATION=-
MSVNRKASTVGGLRSTRAKRSKGSADTEKDLLQSEDNYLQSEYITNLQQQIYFLELELQVMKEKQASGRFAGKALGSNVPLDTHMNSLRDKYMSMEKKFKKKIRKMEEETESSQRENEEIKLKVQDLEGEHSGLTQKVEQYEQQIEAENNSHLADKLKFEQRIEKLNEKLTEKTNLYETIADKYREFRIETRSEIDTLKENIRSLKKEIEDQKKRMSLEAQDKEKCQVQLIECQENVTLKQEEISTLKEENFNYRDVVRGWEHKYRKLEMDIEQERGVSTKYETENQSLRKKILELEQQLREEQTQVSNMQKSENRWSETVVRLRNEIERKQQEAKSVAEQLNDGQIKIQQFIEDTHRLNEQLTDNGDKLSQVNEQLTATNATVTKLEQANLELKKENLIKTDVVDKFEAEKEDLHKQLQKYKQQQQSLQVECNALTQKLSISNKLENINFDEFKNLCSTNLRVADSIKHLMSTLNQDSISNDKENQLQLNKQNEQQ